MTSKRSCIVPSLGVDVVCDILTLSGHVLLPDNKPKQIWLKVATVRGSAVRARNHHVNRNLPQKYSLAAAALCLA